MYNNNSITVFFLRAPIVTFTAESKKIIMNNNNKLACHDSVYRCKGACLAEAVYVNTFVKIVLSRAQYVLI